MNGPLIMVVDDDDDLRELITLLVRAQGFCTIDAIDGLDALDKLGQGALPSLILLDLRMPRMNGIEFLAEVQDTRAARIPVVALTGDLGACQEARRAGAIECLRKPIDAHALLGAIRTHAAAGPHHDAVSG